MSRNVESVPLKEKNTFRNGKGSTYIGKDGPVPKGRDLGNKGTGGGVTTATKGKFKS